MTVSGGWQRLEPLLLLIGAGGSIGMIFPMSKIAGNVGLPPLSYAALSAAGACFVLLAVASVAREDLRVTRSEIVYASIAGQLTFAVPFGALVAIVPVVGSGIPAILQSLAPMATLVIVSLIGFERPNLLGGVGIALGALGVILVLTFRGLDSSAPAAWYWYPLALVTPISLAIGNVFRSTHWPRSSRALPLACFTLAAAALGLCAIAVLLRAAGLIAPLTAGLQSGWPLVAAQSVALGAGYACFFRLQQVGGPVYLSQISYVNTAVGLIFAVTLLGERLPEASWLASILILAGILLVAIASKPAARSRGN